MNKIAVYTAIFGEYDILLPPVISGEADYIIFSDREFIPPAPWQLRLVRIPDGTDYRHASRYYFTQSTITQVCADYDITIMHGGNAQLKVNPEVFLPFIESTDIASFKHPDRDSVYNEPWACNILGLDTYKNMNPQMNRYKEDGFNGSPFSACILLIRRNTPAIRDFESLWWKEVRDGSYRDQLSFDYCRWKKGLGITYIPGHCFKSDYLIINAHNRINRGHNSHLN